MTIRPEKETDMQAIFDVTKEAFKDHPCSQQTEQFIINALRKDNALTISLVAEIDGAVAGHVAFSPVTISDGSSDWYGLGPVAVQPSLQRRGIGQALIREGLARLKALGARGCVLVGDPAYYVRFGFKSFPGLGMEGIPQENVMALSFCEDEPTGTITHHHAFAARE